MKKPLLGAFAAVAVAGLLMSCIVISDPEAEPGWRTVPETGEAAPSGPEFTRTLPFTPGGTLSVDNAYGDIEIMGWDRDEVEVVARAAAGAAQPPRSAREAGGRGSVPEIEV
ncbi:MAG: hypothetical protein ACM32H_00565, partial [Candidatus Aminicenantes bacterium RBG_16_66_30]